MASSSTEQRTFTFGAIEWDNYMKYRPRYPPSLINLIKAHHQQYCNRYNLAHDVASGSGVFVPVIVDDLGFQHVHVSDPGLGNIRSSQTILSGWCASRESSEPSTKTILTFSKTTGEEMHTCTVSHSVDLVTVMEAAHWMDGPKMMTSAAETLAPDGTLALVIYAAALDISNSEPASIAFNQALGALWKHVLMVKQQANEVGAAELERGIQQGCVGLDWIEIDAAQWKNVRRIRVHGTRKQGHPHHVPYSDANHTAPTKVNPTESYEYYGEQDEQATGWRKEVNSDWFHGYLSTMEAPEHILGMAEYKALISILQEKFPQGSGIEVEWPVDVILATRR